MLEPQKEFTPKIRHDIKLFETSPAEDGSKQWLIYDPIQNRYFTIGIDSFELFGLWEDGVELQEFVALLESKGYETDLEALKTFINFLTANHLTKATTYEDVKRLEYQKKNSKQSFFKWLIHNYLFIKIPLFKPDRWLGANVSKVSFMYSGIWSLFIIVLGVIGITSAFREWELFMNTFLYFFSLEGFVYYAIALVMVKSLHELGHAFTAKRNGCRVSSIGVAFMVLMPVLYTDTTNAYALKSKHKRLMIALAGIKVEIYLAMIALFFWSYLDAGPLKSIAFTTATTSLLASLFINLSPFMRFDGYYVLSDLTDTKNLQPRAFAYTRWFLRKYLVGIKDEPPEIILGNKKSFFVIYSISTWIYRFLLFLGIALLVYYFAFKVLGIILFAVEILWFIVLPIVSELKIWWQRKADMRLNRSSGSFVIVLILLSYLFFVPWYANTNLPAIIIAEQYANIYPPKDAIIKKVHIKNNDTVRAGQSLIELELPQLNLQMQNIKKEISTLQIELSLLAGNQKIRADRFVLEQSLQKAYEELRGLQKLQSSLAIKAPFDGIIRLDDKLESNQAVSKKESLFAIYNPDSISIIAYCKEDELATIKQNSTQKSKALFVANNGEIKNIEATITEISPTSSSLILYPELSSIYDGPIATRQASQTQSKISHSTQMMDNQINSYGTNLISESAYFKVKASFDKQNFDFRFRLAGNLRVEAQPISFYEKYLNKVIVFLVRESGF